MAPIGCVTQEMFLIINSDDLIRMSFASVFKRTGIALGMETNSNR